MTGRGRNAKGCRRPAPAGGRKSLLPCFGSLRRFPLALGLAGLIAISGCTGSESRLESASDRLRMNVVTTTSLIGDLASRIGGRHVKVQSLMGPGVDPHLYKASEGDVARLSSADLILFNGLHLEGAMADLFVRMAGNTATVAVAEGIDPVLLLSPSEFKGNFDPHVWFDVSLWIQAAARVADALVELDSTHREEYRANYGSFAAELSDLDLELRTRIEELPSDRRVLITAHDAFNYFGRAYGFEVRGLQGISTAAEAGTADVQALAEFIATRKIPAIFVETSVPPRSIEAVQAAVRARGFEVKIGGHLYSDALGAPATPEGTYTGMIRYNVETVVAALLGES